MIRRLAPADMAWAEALVDREFAGRNQARLGALVDAFEGDGLVAAADGDALVGLLTWMVGGAGSTPDQAEIRVVAMDPRRRGEGIGAALMAAAEAALRDAGVREAWLVTTNDNVRALAFYQRRGWRLARLVRGAVDEARRTLKPSVPRVAENGIPMHDELVLTREL